MVSVVSWSAPFQAMHMPGLVLEQYLEEPVRKRRRRARKGADSDSDGSDVTVETAEVVTTDDVGLPEVWNQSDADAAYMQAWAALSSTSVQPVP